MAETAVALNAVVKAQQENAATLIALNEIQVRMDQVAANKLAESELLPLPKAAAPRSAAGSSAEDDMLVSPPPSPAVEGDEELPQADASAVATPASPAAVDDNEPPQAAAASAAASPAVSGGSPRHDAAAKAAASHDEGKREKQEAAMNVAPADEKMSEADQAAILDGIVSPPPGLRKEDVKRSVSRTQSRPRQRTVSEELFDSLAATSESEEEQDDEPEAAAGRAATPPPPPPLPPSCTASASDVEQSGDESNNVTVISSSEEESEVDPKKVWQCLCEEFSSQDLDEQLRDVTAVHFLLTHLKQKGVTRGCNSFEEDAKKFVAEIGCPKTARVRVRTNEDAHFNDIAYELFGAEVKDLKEELHKIRVRRGKIYPEPKTGNKETSGAAGDSAATTPAPAASASSATAPTTDGPKATIPAAAARGKRLNLPLVTGMMILEHKKLGGDKLSGAALIEMRNKYWEQVKIVEGGEAVQPFRIPLKMVDNVPGLKKSKSMVEDGVQIHPGIMEHMRLSPGSPGFWQKIACQLGEAGQTHVTDTQDVTEDGVYRCMICPVSKKGGGSRGTEITHDHFKSLVHIKNIKNYLDASKDQRRQWYPLLNTNELIGYAEFPDDVVMDKIAEKPGQDGDETSRGRGKSLFPEYYIENEMKKVGTPDVGSDNDSTPDFASGGKKRGEPETRESRSPERRRIVPGGKRGKSGKRDKDHAGRKGVETNDWGKDTRWVKDTWKDYGQGGWNDYKKY